MTEFLLYFEVNIICIIVLAIIGINIKVSEYSSGRRPRIMLRLIVSTIGFYLLDILGGYVRMDKLDPNPTVVFVLSALYFLLFALSAYHWFFYSEILHNKAFFDRPRRQLLTFLPIAGLLVLLVVSYFNGCLFSVTEKDGYARGPFFAVQALLSLAYLVAAWLRCSYFARRVPRMSVRHDYLIFEKACALLARWNTPPFDTLFLSCNFTRLSVSAPDFAERLDKIASRYAFARHRLVVEVTESSLCTDPEAVSNNIRALDAHGFRVAIDDMGAGFSSLADIYDNEINIVKIERNFLATCVTARRRQMLENIITLVHNAGAAVICEGVETAEQQAMLRAIGCDMMQGFYHCRVLPLTEGERFFLTYGHRP